MLIMASADAASTAVAYLDARPILPVADDTVLDQALALRDRFAAAIAAVLEQENVRANLIKSEPGNYPAWIRLEAWIRVGAESPPRHERCELELIFDVRPFNRHHVVCGARLTRGKRTIAVAERSGFSERDVAEWTRHAIGRGPRPSNFRPVLDALREQLGIFIPPLSRRHNPIERQFRTARFGLRTLLVAAACALLAAALMYREVLGPVALGLGGAAFLVAVLLPAFGRYFRCHDWVVPQPRESPRHLGHVDSWHAVLVGLGGQAGHLARHLVAKIEETPAGTLEIRAESYGYRTPNGYEERERLVVSHQQCHIHVHIQPLGDDLFVGWHALLNWAQWAETTPVNTLDAGRRSIVLHDIKPSWYYPGEFDLIDLNSLSAVVHNAMEGEVKSLLREHAIDQEVDFEVIRGDRGNALDARKAWPERPNERRRNSNTIFGWGAVQRASAGQMQLTPVDVKPPGRPRGIAAIPAVILLPVLAALGYFWLYLANGALLYRLDQQIGTFTFTFLPMFHLPFAAVLALGLLLYARISLVRALLVAAAIEASSFCMGYAYYTLASQLIVARDLSPPPLALAFSAGATAITGLCYLMAAAIWVPELRDGKRWLAALVLWTAWGAASSWAVGQYRILPPQSLIVFWSLRVFMAACFGYWLWAREKGAWAPAARARSKASSRAERPARPRTERRSFLLPLAAVFVLLGLVELFGRAASVNRFLFPLPSVLVSRIPDFLVANDLASLLALTFGQVFTVSVLVTLAGVVIAWLLQRMPPLRTAIRPGIGAMAAAPVLLIYPLAAIYLGLNDASIELTAFLAGLAPAILGALGGLEGSPGRRQDSFRRMVLSTWLLALTLAFANVVTVDMLLGSPGLGLLIDESAQKFDVVGLYSGLCLAILIGVVLSVVAASAGAATVPDELPAPASGPSPQSAAGLRIVIVLAILVGWEAVARSISSDLLMPSLATIGGALASLLADPQFGTAVGVSASRIAAGLLIGGAGGLALGLLLRRVRWLRRALEPILYNLNPTPKMAFFPVALLLFGIGAGSLVALGALACFFPFALRVAAVSEDGAEPDLRRALAEGLRSGLRVTILLTLLAEGYASSSGLGFLLAQSEQRFDTPQLYALLIVVLGLSILADMLVGGFARSRATQLEARLA
jgi:ABC-type nitrate/sulfonate/bicarbonate transport system permease component